MNVMICDLSNLLKTLKGLGKSVVEVLVDDNGVCYILLTNVLTPEAQRFINTQGLIRLKISTVQYHKIMGNSSMNMRDAIQSGVVKREADTPDNIWNMLCRKACIVEEPLTKTLSLLAQYTAACVLYVSMKITGAQL